MGANAAGVAMFFAGLILLIPHRIGMSRVNYVIKRYNLPISRAGLLLYKFHNNIELSLLIGCVLGGAITIPVSLSGSDDDSVVDDIINHRKYVHIGHGIAGKKWYRDSILICMFTILFLMIISSIFLYIIYISGDDFGHLNAFYLTLILLTFFDGFTNAFAFCVNGFNAGLYAVGVPLSGFLLTGLHNIYKFLSDKYLWDDFDYHILRLQLTFNIIQLLLCLGTWIGLHGYTFPVKQQATGPTAADCSPILLLAFSLGTVYIFYPSIAPYSIIDFQYAAIIELYILCISVIPTVALAIWDAATQSDTNAFGPGCRFGGNNSSIDKTWSDEVGGGWYWHFVWFCAIPYILCIQIFMSLLHYPHCLLSCFFNNKPFRIGFISVLFSTLRETMQVCGFAGAGKQANPTASKHMHPGLASSNKPITLIVMMFCVFTGDGYLQHYRRCCRDCWPTTGYNKYQSFFYWLHYGFKGGIKSITSSFTDLYYHNIRPQIISYA